MKIYVAGPMRGLPEFNFPAFHEAARRLRAKGHEVFNPAERDIARHGLDISKGNMAGCEKLAAEQHGFNIREALADDLDFICRQADAVALLPGWQESRGALAEVHAARALDLLILSLEAMERWICD